MAIKKPLDETSHLYLIDGSGYIFRAYHALPPLTRSDGTPVGAVQGFCNMLWKLLEDLKGEDAPTHRKRREPGRREPGGGHLRAHAPLVDMSCRSHYICKTKIGGRVG